MAVTRSAVVFSIAGFLFSSAWMFLAAGMNFEEVPYHDPNLILAPTILSSVLLFIMAIFIRKHHLINNDDGLFSETNLKARIAAFILMACQLGCLVGSFILGVQYIKAEYTTLGVTSFLSAVLLVSANLLMLLGRKTDSDSF